MEESGMKHTMRPNNVFVIPTGEFIKIVFKSPFQESLIEFFENDRIAYVLIKQVPFPPIIRFMADSMSIDIDLINDEPSLMLDSIWQNSLENTIKLEFTEATNIELVNPIEFVVGEIDMKLIRNEMVEQSAEYQLHSMDQESELLPLLKKVFGRIDVSH